MTSCCNEKKSCCDAKGKAATLTIALVGNPNCGKTTLFNALTGSRQHVGNWPGVTVERKSGTFSLGSTTIEVVDLPGTYSLTLPSATAAIDECIACHFILEKHADVVVNIVDASNLDRHLYLTMQLLEMGVPVILALNMMDVARAREIQIDLTALSRELGCPVLALEAVKGGGVADLKRAIVSFDAARKQQKHFDYPAEIINAVNQLNSMNNDANAFSFSIRLLEDDVYARNMAIANSGQVRQDILQEVARQQAIVRAACNQDADILIADARYRYIQQIIKKIVTRGVNVKTSWTTRIDNVVLNRVLGIPIFLAVMYLLFVFAINIGGVFQDFFDISSQTIFVDGLSNLLAYFNAPTWLNALLANGIGKGINTTITFIPVIGAMFLFLALLEDSGYMARAAFVIDRLMRALGLPGKAFVPMIVGFGCNVPAVMAARTLENKRDRILTIMMSPFMSCGARLAIYAVFTAAFFQHRGQNVVFALYLIGILMAVLTGFILRTTMLKGDPSPLVMELPSYHLPHVKTLLLHAWQRLKGFVFRAGKLIVPICVLIGALNSFNMDGTLNAGNGDTHSLLSIVGQWVTPIFAPMGIHADNWPATVGLVTGILAKEVVVGTLNTLYTQMGHVAAVTDVSTFHFFAGLKSALQSIPENISQLSSAFSNPILAKAPIQSVNQGVYGVMSQKFDGQIGAFAYLLFVLLYFPCISTMAVMMRELHRGWSIFSAFWTTGIAYGVAVTFYQAATFTRHPYSSFLWISAMVSFFIISILAIRYIASRGGKVANVINAEPVAEMR